MLIVMETWSAFTNVTISSVTVSTIVHVNLNASQAVQIVNLRFVYAKTIIILVRIGSLFSKLDHLN